MKLEVDSYDYGQAVAAVDKLLTNINCSCKEGELQDMPSADEIVDKVIEAII